MTTIGEHTRAAVVRAFGEPISVEDVPVPPKVEAGGLLVEVVACSLCGTDVHCWEGSLALDIRLPLI
ncbi:hypothetical protein ACZ91_62950, partial [Streptomyces regensis]